MTTGVEGVLARWETDDERADRIVHVEDIPAREPIFSELDLHPALAARLTDRGIDELYRHQARAIKSIRSGTHTVIEAGTAAGKTLAYQIPLVESLLENAKSTSLLLYPTKALAQDQHRSLATFRLPGLNPALYDGDTDRDDRVWARRHASSILTNPDMLHVGILPNHRRWSRFFSNLDYVVIDEMHSFKGIFGTHVALILRRLRRIAQHYGSEPTFVLTSATIGNPEQLGSALLGLPVRVTAGDDSPAGRRLIALWNPEMEDPELGSRRSSLAEASDLFRDLVNADAHTILFARSRRGTELVYRWARDGLGADRAARIAPYRGGYLAQQRREIEDRLFSGDLLGVIATNALELGIDVGSLDASVIASFPGTVSSFRQQSGRAGRSTQTSLGVLVAGADALDQYFMEHPHELFDRVSEAAVVNPDNPFVLEAHVGCAAHELPVDLEDRVHFGDGLEEAVSRLTAAGHTRMRDGAIVWSRRDAPAPRVPIRSSGGTPFVILDDEGESLGTLDQQRAFRDAHPDAVYLHQGDTYVVDRLDLDQREARVSCRNVDYYTQPRQEQDLEILDVEATQMVGRLRLHLGGLRVESQVTGYERRRIGTREKLGSEYLDLPSVVYETMGFWYTIPPDLLDGLDLEEMLGTLHAAEHAGIAMLPLFAICDRWDIGGLSTNMHYDTGRPTIFIYEGHAGGAGISPVAYDRGADHLAATLDLLERCECRRGCPSCVVSPKCGNLNEPLSKQGAIGFLRRSLG